MLRLRQIAIVVTDRDAATADIATTFDLAVAYDDPHVRGLGLHNNVLPLGVEMVEVMSPLQAGTTFGRYLERRGGDGGYMVILQTDDLAAARRRVDDLGVRVVGEYGHRAFQNMQLHPRDTGGAFLEIDQQGDGIDLASEWRPAGPDWRRAVRVGSVVGIVGVEIQSSNPIDLARRWADIVGATAGAGPHPVIPLSGAAVRFVPLADDRGDGIAAIDVVAIDPDAVRSRAEARGLDVGPRHVVAAGVRWNLR